MNKEANENISHYRVDFATKPIRPNTSTSNYVWTTGSEHQGQIEISDHDQISDCLIW